MLNNHPLKHYPPPTYPEFYWAKKIQVFHNRRPGIRLGVSNDNSKSKCKRAKSLTTSSSLSSSSLLSCKEFCTVYLYTLEVTYTYTLNMFVCVYVLLYITFRGKRKLSTSLLIVYSIFLLLLNFILYKHFKDTITTTTISIFSSYWVCIS